MRRSALAEKYDSASLVRQGRPWTVGEINILKQSLHVRTKDLLHLLPSRSKNAIQGKRRNSGLMYRKVSWTPGEDDEIRVIGRRTGPGGLVRILPHRTETDIKNRARLLGVSLFNKLEQPLKVIGEPLADAIRKRALEDGISIRALDRELGRSGYFSNVAGLRARRGSGPYMPAIRKALDFFGAELVTAPDGTMTIDWKDE